MPNSTFDKSNNPTKNQEKKAVAKNSHKVSVQEEDFASAISRIPGVKTNIDALKVVGMQHEFAAQIVTLGIDVSFRASEPPSYDSIRAPKSGLNLSKSSNHGFGKALIPAIKIFTKLDDFGRPIGWDPKDAQNLEKTYKMLAANPPAHEIPLDQYPQPIVQLRHSLRDILEMSQNEGEMEIVAYNESSGELIIKYRNGDKLNDGDKLNGPKGFNGEFVIHLKDPKEPKLAKRHYSRPWNKPTEPPQNLEVIGAKLPQTASLLKSQLDKEFDIFFRNEHGEDLKKFMVFCDKEGNIVTGDWDIFMMGQSTSLSSSPEISKSKARVGPTSASNNHSLSAYAHVVHNTFQMKHETDKTNVLFRRRVLSLEVEKLFKDLKQQAMGQQKKIDELGEALANKVGLRLTPSQKVLLATTHASELYEQGDLAKVGYTTPYEFLQASILNASYQNEKSLLGPQKKGNVNPEFDPNIKNLIQHGPENRNPYAPSKIGKILHFYKGMIILTENEDQLIDFYMAAQGQYLKDNVIDIHFGWKMSKWGKILEQQERLGQINLKNIEANPPQKQKAIRSYLDYQKILLLEETRQNKLASHLAFELSDQEASVVMRQIMHYQEIPEGLMKALIAKYNDKNFLKFHFMKETTPGNFHLKDFQLPIELWHVVVQKQMEMHEQNPRVIPEVPLEIKKCYENYFALQNIEKALAMGNSIPIHEIIRIIDAQLDFNQRSSIPNRIMQLYNEALSPKSSSQQTPHGFYTSFKQAPMEQEHERDNASKPMGPSVSGPNKPH